MAREIYSKHKKKSRYADYSIVNYDAHVLAQARVTHFGPTT